MKRLVTLALAVLLVVGLGAGGYVWYQSRNGAPKFRTARVERGPLTAAVSATGNLNAVITVLVGSQVSGQVQELHADFNSVVKRNQVIARIDPEVFEAKVSQAKADLESVKAAVLNQIANLEKARADLENARAALGQGKAMTAKSQAAMADAKRIAERNAELFGRGLIAAADRDTAQANAEQAIAQMDSSRANEQALAAGIQAAQAQLRVHEAAVASARATVEQKTAALKQAQIDLEHTTIRAPVDGVVVSRAVDVGQTVAASLQAPTLFTIAQDLTKMQVETSVDEADIGRVRLDGPVTFTVDAFPGEAFQGRVTQIRKAALVVQNVVTYTVVVAVANPNQRLLPGMTANVKMVIAEKPNVLKISNAALRFRPPGAEPGPPGGGRGDGGAHAGAGVAQAREPAASGGRGAGGGAQMRERLVGALKLDAAQQAKLDEIFQDTRQQMVAAQGAPEGERAGRIQKIREESRTKIRAILTPDQQKRYDEIIAAATGAGAPPGRRPTQGRVFVVDGDGKPKAVAVVLGITDGSTTEVLQGDLREGQDVIVGLAGGATGRQPQAPGPRMRL